MWENSQNCNNEVAERVRVIGATLDTCKNVLPGVIHDLVKRINRHVG